MLTTQETTRRRHYLEVAGVVVVWMAAGFFLRLTVPVYLALGTALALLFQLRVARRPWPQIWVRSASGFGFDLATGLIALALVGGASALLVAHVGGLARGGGQAGKFCLIVAGALPAAFALRHTTWAGVRAALPSVAAFYAVGWIWGQLVTWIGHAVGVTAAPKAHVTLQQLPTLGADWLANFLYAFLVEEVVFRGVFDPHVATTETTRWGGFRSALFVSALWGIWHVPMQGRGVSLPLAQLGLALHIVGIVIAGVPLAFCWRRSGTLVLPAALHALGNAWIVNAAR
jgi:membrane protease YdiL (CAAX protease family)